MRKLLSLILVLLLVSALFIGCGQSNEPAETPAQDTEQTNDADNAQDSADAEDTDAADDMDTAAYADGTYYTEQADFDAETGWKENITITVEGGMITTVDWNGTSEETAKDKKTASVDGEYPMVEYGGAMAPWHEQAAAVEAYLIEKQDPNAITVDGEGKTDAISGASITVSSFVALSNEALAAGPTAGEMTSDAGMYVDGTFTAEDADFDAETGWKENITITVENGFITAVDWNGTSEETTKDKKTASVDGDYPMVEYGGAMAPWHEQAAVVEAYLIATQDPNAIALTAEGKTDAITGASITVSNFVKLANEALELR